MFDPSGDEHVPVKQYWTLIDEFNRAPIDKSFGQLFTALRDGTLRQIPTMNGKDEEMKIPSDYRIIGTLNTQDKSHIFTISNALKSRFASIIIDIPKIEDAGKEMYFAAKNALEELEDIGMDDYKNIISLDKDGLERSV